MICCRESLKTVSVRRKVMRYEAKDFLATASPDALRKIARARELTREYYFSAYGDTRRRREILQELLGGIGDNVMIDTPFHCDYGKNIFLGSNVVINMNCTLVELCAHLHWQPGVDCVQCSDLYGFASGLASGTSCDGMGRR